MPEIGEIKTAREIGFKGTNRFIWHACLDCGIERWVLLFKGKPQNLHCRNCRGKHIRGTNNSRWKGGSINKADGYRRLPIYKDDPLFDQIKQRNMREHRLIMTRYLGRVLKTYEVVHHLNGIRIDNRIENLVVINRHKHPSHTLTKLLQARIRELEQLRLPLFT